MPKRNRHREQLKAQGRLGVKPVSPSAGPAKPPPPRAQGATVGAPGARPPKTEGAQEAPKARPRSPTPRLSPEARALKHRLRRLRHEAHLKAKVPSVLEVLSSRWPQVFPEDTTKARPWAVGLFKELVKENLEFSRILLRETLKRYSKTVGYQSALAAGGPRYDLKGVVQGEVTAEQMAQAAGRLQQIKEKAERQKAEKEKARQEAAAATGEAPKA
ncbi:MAG: ProQ/FinO family protein [Candidatus Riflebacteria bacterium]|nr:ProQ/FinO family protein [Candidatus Riflebacteria bacterium]